MSSALSQTTITGRIFLIGLASALGSLFVLSHVLHGRRAEHLRVLPLAGISALVIVGAGINSYFSYYPTVGSLLGRTATYQASAEHVAHAESVAYATHGQLPTHGMVESVTIPSTISGFKTRRAQVYLPRVWFAVPRPHLPVLMLLHGTPGTPQDWTRAGSVDVVAERWATRHGGAAPIIVMPDSNGSFWGDTECVDGRLGMAETYLSVDVPNWATLRLGASTDRSEWGVGGLSSGGTCAIHLALRHPDRFSMFAAFGSEPRITHTGGVTALFAGSPQVAARRADGYDPAALLARYRPVLELPMRGWFEAGSNDGAITRSTKMLAHSARERGIETTVRLVPGGRHTFHTWRRSISDSYPWIVSNLVGPAATEKAPFIR